MHDNLTVRVRGLECGTASSFSSARGHRDGVGRKRRHVPICYAEARLSLTRLRMMGLLERFCLLKSVLHFSEHFPALFEHVLAVGRRLDYPRIGCPRN
jgi:hypothetical protein